MSGQNYDNPTQITYSFAQDFIGGANVDGRIQGPAGKRGRVLSLTTVYTTGVTVTASSASVNTVAGLAAAPSLVAPIGAVNTGYSATAANLKAASELPADTIVEVRNAGGSTAGVGRTEVVIGWY